MKVTVEVDCTPQEARTFFGLPDVTPLNDHLVEAMKTRFDANVALLKPEELVKSWMSFGGQAQESFRRLLAASGGTTGSEPK